MIVNLDHNVTMFSKRRNGNSSNCLGSISAKLQFESFNSGHILFLRFSAIFSAICLKPLSCRPHTKAKIFISCGCVYLIFVFCNAPNRKK